MYMSTWLWTCYCEALCPSEVGLCQEQNFAKSIQEPFLCSVTWNLNSTLASSGGALSPNLMSPPLWSQPLEMRARWTTQVYKWKATASPGCFIGGFQWFLSMSGSDTQTFSQHAKGTGKWDRTRVGSIDAETPLCGMVGHRRHPTSDREGGH